MNWRTYLARIPGEQAESQLEAVIGKQQAVRERSNQQQESNVWYDLCKRMSCASIVSPLAHPGVILSSKSKLKVTPKYFWVWFKSKPKTIQQKRKKSSQPTGLSPLPPHSLSRQSQCSHKIITQIILLESSLTVRNMKSYFGKKHPEFTEENMCKTAQNPSIFWVLPFYILSQL